MTVYLPHKIKYLEIMKTKLKKIQTVFYVALLVLLSVSQLQAQQNGQQSGQQGPRPIPNDQQIEEMVTDLSKELSLNEKQEEQISDLYIAHFKEVEKMREIQKEARDADREEMRNYRDSFEKEIKTNLSEEQQSQFDVYIKEKRSERGKQAKQGKQKNK